MEELAQLLQEETPVFVDFYADWCGPCQTMEPIIEDIKKKYGNKLRVVKIDVDKNTQVTQKFKIRSVPTYLLFNKGEIQWKAAGLFTRSELKNQINKVLD